MLFNLKRHGKVGLFIKLKKFHNFCSGQPVDDPLHPDYAPNINMGYERKLTNMNRWKARQKREEAHKDRIDREVAAAKTLQALSSVNKAVLEDLNGTGNDIVY